MARTLQRKPADWVTIAGAEETGDLVQFLMTPASALQHEIALDRASAAARELQESEEVRKAYGLDALQVADIGDDGEALLGLSATLLATELALIVATELRGYLGEDGESPARFDRRTIALVMQDWHTGQSMAQRFLLRALVPIYRSIEEGKS